MGHLAALTSRPYHERVHGPLHTVQVLLAGGAVPASGLPRVVGLVSTLVVSLKAGRAAQLLRRAGRHHWLQVIHGLVRRRSAVREGRGVLALQGRERRGTRLLPVVDVGAARAKLARARRRRGPKLNRRRRRRRRGIMLPRGAGPRRRRRRGHREGCDTPLTSCTQTSSCDVAARTPALSRGRTLAGRRGMLWRAIETNEGAVSAHIGRWAACDPSELQGPPQAPPVSAGGPIAPRTTPLDEASSRTEGKAPPVNARSRRQRDVALASSGKLRKTVARKKRAPSPHPATSRFQQSLALWRDHSSGQFMHVNPWSAQITIKQVVLALLLYPLSP